MRRLAAHSDLDAEERDAVLQLPVQLLEVRSNVDFVRLGEQIDHACLVAEGLVGKFGQTEDGRRQIVSVHIPGEMADLSSLMMPQAATALNSLSSTTILRVAHKDLRALGLRYPSIATAFWRSSVLDGAIVAQWLVNVGRRDARARLAHLFCEMAVRYRLLDQSDGRRYTLPMTQEQLGDALGLTSVHVNRTLQHLREEKLLRVERSAVTIMDWKALVRAGEFDTLYLQRPDL
ncbi:Crp/Fnr family transcriptional regulator [Sphingomonas jatrophae]|uniref:Crp/Fnr family transcriptional regulator n=1 Tax=Sphingomonas jatrophae TaxID=1166337 RepID=UPI0013F4F709|nr:Crp/Fnr family transcriptional regulator [Sphingomonas jatrophae]